MSMFQGDTRHLSKSILLEETGSPGLVKVVLLLSVLLLGAFGTWSATTELSEVATATGQVEPVTQIRSVEHLKGGVVDKIFVANGQKINANDPLLELEGREMQLELKKHRIELAGLLSSKLRLAKQVGLALPKPDSLDQAQLMLEQRLILEKFEDFKKRRREILQGQAQQYFQAELTELAESQRIYDDLAQTNEAITKRVASIEALKSEIEDLVILSPSTGTVHALSATKGMVIKPGVPILSIIPNDLGLAARVRISTKDIGHLRVGQGVRLKFFTYHFARYGVLEAKLDELSVTTLVDERQNPYYEGKVFLPKNYLGNDPQKLPISAGMTLQADIKTGQKTVIEYLLKPIFASAEMALRER